MENIINRVKNILVSPKTEWKAIEAENAPYAKVFTSYVVLLALIPAVAAFIGYGLTGCVGLHFGVRQAIMQYVVMLGGTYLTAFIIDALATNFGAVKDFNRSFSLVAYSYTPMFVGGVFYLLLPLAWLASLAGLYGLYLLYTGLQPMMKAPEDKQTTYFIVSLIVTIVVSVILSSVLGFIFSK